MTTVEVYRRNSVPFRVRVFGHSGYGTEGNDVVCAAVSVLVQTLYLGLSDVLKLKPDAQTDAEKAVIDIRWSCTQGAQQSESLRVLSETITQALRAVAESYGSYVKYAEVSL